MAGRLHRCAAIGALLMAGGGVLEQAPATAAPEAAPTVTKASTWPIAGRQGIIQVIIVPEAESRDRAAYQREIAALCPPTASCFINFHTNSTGAPLSVPLPDAIAAEATALFRRSVKQGGEFFRWSCRLGVPEGDCF